VNKSSAFVKARCRALGRDARGASAVEFAIVAPMLIVLLIGVVAVGWAIYSMVTVHYALEESGRALMLDPSLTEDELNTMVQANTGDSSVTVTLSIDAQVGDKKLAHLSADYEVTISIPMLPDYTIAYQTSLAVPLPPS
jgi:Flp pilus assembly protein TadG